MSDERLSFWGIGPSMVLTALAYAAVAWSVAWQWPEWCLVPPGIYPVLAVIGGCLLLLGLALLVLAGRAVSAAYRGDQLATTGAFGVVRHPVYAVWIVLLLPGLALLSGAWPVLPAPLVAYAVFRRRIGVEERYLDERFGQAYRDYRARVGELLPRLWSPR